MELWIVSQDKEAFQITTGFRVFENRIQILGINSGILTVGIYASKERALEVLADIKSKMKQQFIVESHTLLSLKDIDREEDRLRWKYDKEFIMTDLSFQIEPINTEIYVYEMPQE